MASRATWIATLLTLGGCPDDRGDGDVDGSGAEVEATSETEPGDDDTSAPADVGGVDDGDPTSTADTTTEPSDTVPDGTTEPSDAVWDDTTEPSDVAPDDTTISDVAPDDTTTSDVAPDDTTPAATVCPMLDDGDVLFELGHVAPLVGLRRSGARVASLDDDGTWALWDTDSGRRLAGGDDPDCPADDFGACETVRTIALGSDTLVVRSTNDLQVVDARSGATTATLATTSTQAGVADDGAFVWAASATGLGLWAPDGTPRGALTGDYAAARVLADAEGVWIALGPAGPTVIEHLAPGAAAATTSAPFAGAFHSWFETGARFVTTVGNVVRVYAKDGSAVAPLWTLPSVSRLRGHGDTLSTCCPLRVFAFGETAPIFEPPVDDFYRFVGADASFIAVAARYEDVFRVVDLAGGAVGVTIVDGDPDLFAADATGAWVTDDLRHASAPDGAVAARLACGFASSDGNADGRLVVTTASGWTSVVDLAADGGRTRVGDFLARGEGARITAAGDRLVWFTIASADRDTDLEVRALPSGALVRSTPIVDDDAQTVVRDFDLAASGTALAMVVCRFTGGCDAVVTDLGGVSTQLTAPITLAPSAPAVPPPLRLSPDGTRTAVGHGGETASATTSIYEGDVLVGAAPGFPATWLDHDRLLVVRCVTGRLGSSQCNTADVVDASGAVLASLPLGFTVGAEPASAELVYDRLRNALYTLADGARVWVAPGRGTIAGAWVAYQHDHRVRLHRHTPN